MGEFHVNKLLVKPYNLTVQWSRHLGSISSLSEVPEVESHCRFYIFGLHWDWPVWCTPLAVSQRLTLDPGDNPALTPGTSRLAPGAKNPTAGFWSQPALFLLSGSTHPVTRNVWVPRKLSIDSSLASGGLENPLEVSIGAGWDEDSIFSVSPEALTPP